MKEGLKFDLGKRRWSLVPFQALDRVIDVLEYGARLYGDHNWRNVDNGLTRYSDAAFRHLSMHARGHLMDPDTGAPHLAHAACSTLFALEHFETSISRNRPKSICQKRVIVPTSTREKKIR